ncbi:MAG: tandem-95 repeat protein [Verrucomicrobiales bacterium]|nr:tandem-95 repeat protein [Verrucomicrobiales bacterium]
MKRQLPGFVLAISLLITVQQSLAAQSNFQDLSTSLPATGAYNLSAGDYDGDGFLDAMIYRSGSTNFDALLYRNTNGYSFTKVALPDTASSQTIQAVLWRDYNGDGLLDFAMTRANLDSQRSIRLYLQDTNHTFTESDTRLEGEVSAWLDLDNDGRPDLMAFITGASGGSVVYWNDGNGSYTRAWLAEGHYVTAGDLDGDGDVDVIVTATEFSDRLAPLATTKILRNDGGRHFADSGVRGSFSALADFNDDGRLDIVESLRSSGSGFPESNLLTSIYYNQSGLVYRKDTVNGISSYYKVMDAADYSGDGLPDLNCFTTSQASGFPPILMLNTNGGFKSSDFTFTAAANDVNSIVRGDFDNEGDLDFITIPRGSSGQRMLRNNLNVTRTVGVPQSLACLVRRDRVDFSWVGSDERATSYNLRVGSAPGKNDILSSESLPNGRRLLSQIGNSGTGRSWHLDRLQPGTYYWSVQAVDWGFRGSEFAPDLSFTVSSPGPMPTAPTISQIENVVLDEDVPAEIDFVIGPGESIADLSVTAESNSSKIVPPAELTVSGSGTNRLLRIVPGTNQNGLATVTLRVTDLFGQSRNASFFVSVLPIADPPEFSEIPDQVVYAGAPDLTVSFTVNDPDALLQPRDLTSMVTASSSDTNLVPNSALRVLTQPFIPRIPAAGPLTIKIPATKVGSTTITLSATNGVLRSSRSFVLLVTPPPFKDMGLRFGVFGTSGTPVVADFNNDGQLDVLAGTNLSFFQPGGESLNQRDFSFPAGGSLVMADFNRDNYLDVLSVSQNAVRLFINQHGTNFSATTQNVIARSDSAHIEAADLDNDGDVDLFMTAIAADLITPITREYLNDNGTWRSVTPPIPGIYGNFALVDIDHDGWIDLVFGGTTANSVATNGVFRGVGGGRFVYQPGSSAFVPPAFSGLADLDSDGAMDLWNTVGRAINFYRNSGGKFDFFASLNPPTNTFLPRVWADLDNDGLLDLILVGSGAAPPFPLSKYSILRNDGAFKFTSLGNPLFSLGAGGIAVADMNNDGSLDIIGPPTNGIGLMILTNTVRSANAQPGVPGDLRAEQINDTLRLSWSAADDLNQPAGLSYNVRVGTATGAVDIVSQLSLANGKRLMMGPGNAGNRTSFVLTNLTREKYFWSVQAVDNSFTGGAFAQEKVAGVALPGNLPPVLTLSPLHYVGGEDQLGTITVSIQDDTTPVNEVRLRVFAADPGFLSFTNFTVTGTGEMRIIRFKPPLNRSGETEMIVQAIDGAGATSTNAVTLTITNVNDVPVISGIADQYSNGPGDPVTASFTIGDIDNAVETLQLSAISGNDEILPPEGIRFGGSGTSRTVTLSTLSSKPGIFPVTIRVTDPAGASASSIFQIAFTNRIFKKLDGQFLGVWSGKTLWGDVDNDGDLDVFVSGPGAISNILYINQGNGTFKETLTLPRSDNGTAEWGDFDNDGNLDLIIQRSDDVTLPLTLYRGDGHGNLTAVSTGMVGHWGPGQFGDFNNDGLLDWVSTGLIQGGTNSDSLIYVNQRGIFAGEERSALAGLFGAPNNLFEDFNLDGRLDLRMRAVTNGIFSDKLLLQTIGGRLEVQLTPNWTGRLLAWADFDNDGLPDSLVSTAQSGNYGTILLQRNWSGTLMSPGIVVADNTLAEAAVVGDYDNDGFADFLVTGPVVSRLFHNQGDGTFEEVLTTLPTLGYQAASWADVDGDGDLDLMISGEIGSSGSDSYVTLLFRNDLVRAKGTLPAPADLRARITGEGVWIEWTPSMKNLGFTYNVAMGTEPGKWDILNPMSATNGWRKIVAHGNVGWMKSKLIRGLEPGKRYYYTVQAIDSGYAGSPFAEEQTFVMESPPQLKVELREGHVQLTLTGEPNRAYIVETSDDLSTWTEFGTFKDAGGKIMLKDSVFALNAARFIRARGE